jgi:Fic family protein
MDDILKRLTVKKKKLEALRPLPKELEQNLAEWFKVELTYSSNAIEGNTLSRIETAEVIERGTAAVISGKSLKDQLEAINHAKATELIKQLAKERKGHQYITEDDIKTIHKIILDSINDEWAGKYRRTEVFVRGSDAGFPAPNAVHYAMQEFVQWLQGQQETHPVRVAAEAHFKFVSIHPFVDGNGRTARLLMNLILIMHDYPIAVIRNEDRVEYLASFGIARKQNNMQPFYDLVETAVEGSLDTYINARQGKSIMRNLNSSSNNQKLLKIGELAKETSETLHTIRHWIEKGLLEAAEHTKANYQLFDRSMVERIKEIRKLQKEKRLTLAEIKQKLSDVIK